MKYNIGDKVWLSYGIVPEGIYTIEKSDCFNCINLCNIYTYRRYEVLEGAFGSQIIHHLPYKVEKKDKIEKLEWIINETRMRQPNTEEIIKKINEIIDYINKED